MATRSQRHVYETRGTINGLYPPAPGPSAPTITSPATRTVLENAAFSLPLTASEPVTWSKQGGDQALFGLTGSTLSMIARDYENPADGDHDNVYVTTLHAVSIATGKDTLQTFSLTVSDVAEDTTPPTITSVAAISLAENAALSFALTANETVTWSKVGGADQALFTVTGSTLSMTAKDFEVPTDADLNNVYVVQIRATDPSNNQTNQTISVTVTNVDETFITDFSGLADSDLSAVPGWSRIVGIVNGAGPRSGKLAGLDTGAPGSLYWITDQGSQNHWVEIVLPNPLPTNSGPFAICRADNTGQNYVGIRSLNQFVECYKREASSMISLYTSGNLLVPGDTLRLECNAQTYTIKRNGAQIQTGSINNVSLNSTRQGFIARSVAVNPFATIYRAGLL